MLAPQLKQWESEGRYLKTVLFQHKVFCNDFGNPAAPPDRTLLLLHGFPESSFSFHKVIGGLAKLFDRVVLFDFPGYGLSDKPLANYTYSLFEQADVALQDRHIVADEGQRVVDLVGDAGNHLTQGRQFFRLH